MASGTTGLLIILAYVETGSRAPLRAEIRLTSDVSAGIERSFTLADGDAVAEMVRRWLDDVLAPVTRASRHGDERGSTLTTMHEDGSAGRRILRTAFRGGPLRFDRRLLVVSLAAAAALAVLTVVVYTHPYLPADAAIERFVQSFDAGPLLYVFAFYTAIGGPLALVAEVVVFGIVLILNYQAWRLVVAAALSSVWYLLLSHLVLRPRPTEGQVLRVTEHPGASSFPSGHTILFVTYGVVLMLCLFYRFLPRSGRPAGWAVVVVLLAVGGISRMYSGAHWPTDVLAGLLIGVGWLSFVVSISWISDPVLHPSPSSEQAVPGGPARRSSDPVTRS